MKTLFTLPLFLITSLLFSQSSYKVVEKNEESTLFKGTIGGSPITMYLENKEILDCDYDDRYIDGWYYYDKYKTKIPLSGFSNNCDMKLFNYGKNHFAIIKKILSNVGPVTIDSIYENSNYQETLKFDRCGYTNQKILKRKGIFEIKGKKVEIIINSDKILVGNDYEYFKLPNSKQIDLMKIFSGYGGNKFFSLKQDKTENRVIFYFHSISNHNACGMCGASEGEKGYRILYFDKKWKLKNKSEFITESCLENLDNTKIIKKSNSLLKYSIKDYEDKILYYLTVDKLNSKITKTK